MAGSGSVVSTSFKLVSEYDNTGIKLAMRDVDALKEQASKTIATVREQEASRMATDKILAQTRREMVEERSRDMTPLGPGGARNLQQMGFMIQDFSSQFNNAKTSAEGFARGIGAISNNIQVMGAGLPPMAQAMFAIGGAATGIILPAVVNWLNDTKAIEEKTKAIEANYERLGPMVRGLQSGFALTSGKMDAEGARAAVDNSINKVTTLSRTQEFMRKKIEQEMAGENRQAQIEAMRKLQTELTAELVKAEMERDAIREVWNEADLQRKLKAIETEKAEKKAAAIEEDDFERELGKAKNQQREEERAQDEKLRRQFDVQQAELQNRIQDLRDQGTNPNGSSAAAIAGSSAATSAINRAVAGTRSEEGDNKRIIKLLEEQLKSSQRVEQKLNFKKAGLDV